MGSVEPSTAARAYRSHGPEATAVDEGKQPSITEDKGAGAAVCALCAVRCACALYSLAAGGTADIRWASRGGGWDDSSFADSTADLLRRSSAARTHFPQPSRNTVQWNTDIAEPGR